MPDRFDVTGPLTDTRAFILSGGRIISMDSVIGDLPRGDVLIEDGRIGAIAPRLDPTGVPIVDVAGQVVMPGFVDSHRHLWETVLRGRAADMSLGGYFGWILGQVGPAFSAEAIYTSTRLGAVEALDAGVTTVFDWCNATNSPDHADAAVGALDASGIRAIFAHGNPADRADVRRLREAILGSRRVTLALALVGPEFSPLEVAAAEIELARELNIVASMHVGCGTAGPRAAAVSRLAAAGLLGPDLNFAHCNTLSDAELSLIVDSGSGVSTTPFVEMLMGHGTPAIGRLLQAGGQPSLGIDVAVASGADLFGQMRSGLAVARMGSNEQLLLRGEDPQVVWPNARDLLRAATLFGAGAIGLGGEVGSLTVGKQADIVILDGAGLPTDPEELVGAIVTTGDASGVDSVIVGGHFAKRQGRLLHHDLAQLRRAAASFDTFDGPTLARLE